MKANVRQYSHGEWKRTVVDTDPQSVRFTYDSDISEREWLQSLPVILVNRKSTHFLEDPEGWLEAMSRARYTRITVEILDAE